MRRGCIATCIIKCDLCANNIEHADRYLVIDSGDDSSRERICVKCCLKKKYAKYIVEKGEEVLTFLVDQVEVKAKKK